MSEQTDQILKLKQKVADAIAYMTGEIAKQKALLFDLREQEDTARKQRYGAHEHLTGMQHRLDTLQGFAKEIEDAEKAGKPVPATEIPTPVPAQDGDTQPQEDVGVVVPFDAAASATDVNGEPTSEPPGEQQ